MLIFRPFLASANMGPRTGGPGTRGQAGGVRFAIRHRQPDEEYGGHDRGVVSHSFGEVCRRGGAAVQTGPDDNGRNHH